MSLAATQGGQGQVALEVLESTGAGEDRGQCCGAVSLCHGGMRAWRGVAASARAQPPFGGIMHARVSAAWLPCLADRGKKSTEQHSHLTARQGQGHLLFPPVLLGVTTTCKDIIIIIIEGKLLTRCHASLGVDEFKDCQNILTLALAS